MYPASSSPGQPRTRFVFECERRRRAVGDVSRHGECERDCVGDKGRAGDDARGAYVARRLRKARGDGGAGMGSVMGMGLGQRYMDENAADTSGGIGIDRPGVRAGVGEA